jgi:methionyl-tRNA formyltransferase
MPEPAPAPLAPVPAGRPRRLVYLGTPHAAVAPLRALVAAGFEVALVVTGADTRRGRGSEPSPSPVKAAAAELGLPASHRVGDVVDVAADLGVVVAFGQLIRRPVLERLAFVNLHFSLLPRWRGAAPVERALLAGDPTTGVCLMLLEEGLDTGPVFARSEMPIAADATLATLRGALVEVGAAMLVRELSAGLGVPEPQAGEPTYAAKIRAEELAIDWTRPAADLDRLVRLGGAWTTFRGRRLIVRGAHVAPADGAPADGAPADGALAGGTPGALTGLAVATGAGALVLDAVQPEGRGTQPAAAWRNGARPADGEALGG